MNKQFKQDFLMNFKKILSFGLLLSSITFASKCCEKTNFYIFNII